MSEGVGPGPLPTASGVRRRWLPFWILQVAEIVIAVVFVDISVHVANGGLLVVAAGALVALALTAKGPLGLVRVCRPQLHLRLTIVVAGIVALAPIVPSFRPDVEGIIVIEFGAIGLIRLATFTETAPRSRGASVRRPAGPAVIEATAVVVDVTTAPGPGSEPAASSGDRPRSAAQGAAARWAGRTAGAAAVTGKRAMDKHRPAAEARVKRTIRSAGRIAGRVTSPPPPEDPDR
ncbi:MAG TPA: hypothetical protein VND67_09665 [Acidimicrobiales bacterium]|nr:hypothetical protein [Acidimicrobiales bacterium]